MRRGWTYVCVRVFDRFNWWDELEGGDTHVSGLMDTEREPFVSCCPSCLRRVNGHEPRYQSQMKESGWGSTWPATPETGSTSQNYYSIHVKPNLNSLDFSIYLVSIGPACAKNTVACLTLAHSVTVCAQRVLTRRYLSDDSNCFVCFVKLWFQPASPLGSASMHLSVFFIYLSMHLDNGVVFM